VTEYGVYIVLALPFVVVAIAAISLYFDKYQIEIDPE
jgi:cell division protein FtsL